MRPAPGAEPYQAASVRPNPLFETSSTDLRTSPQVRAAATLAAAMVGYGFVRSGGAAAGSAAGGGGSLRSSVAAGAVATAPPAATAAPDDPLSAISYADRGERLHQLYFKIEDLKRRSERVMQIAQSIMAVLGKAKDLMAEDPALPLERAALAAARSLGLEDPEGIADAAVEANALTVDGRAASPEAAATAAAAVAVAAEDASSAAMAAAAASVAADVEKSGGLVAAPRSPSPGAAAAAWQPRVSDTIVPNAAVPGGAAAAGGSAAAAPPLQQVPEDSGRVAPPSKPATSEPAAAAATAGLAAWAGEAVEAAASKAPAPPLAPAPPTYGQVNDNPVAETLRPSFRPTRRVTGTPKRAPRMYRAITPPSLPTPPQRPVNPSFDVPEDSPSPEDYLAAADGRSADGRVNPSFAPADVADAAAPAAAAAEPAAAAAAAAAAEPVWSNPMSWFTQGDNREGERPRAHPSFDSSLAVVEESPVVAESPVAGAAAAVADAPEAAVADLPVAAVVDSLTTVAAVVETPAATLAETPAAAVVAVDLPATAMVEEQMVEITASSTAVVPAPAAPEAAAASIDSPPAAAAVVEIPSAAATVAVAVEEELQQVTESRVESVLRAAELRVESTGEERGVGAAAAASSAEWSAALLMGSAAPGDSAPVEQVAELLDAAMRTEEYTYPKYDPLRNVLTAASAPTVAHKYDMLRSLLRAGREEARASAGAADVDADAAQRQPHKYDLIYDLLQSVRTSGDPDAILVASDPKYDPVWSLLNMGAPTRGSLSKYDMVGALLEAALAASPQPSKYDPLQAVLQAQPITGSFKYCIVEALLHGGWQRPLESGLSDLPSWDPLSSVVAGASRTAPPSPEQSSGRCAVSKYDMVGQALEAAAALPEDLASGKWAASQPRDPLLSPHLSPPRPRQPPSKYDMVGQALAAAAALPDDLASGQWAASQGRELLLDTVSRSVDEGGWGVWRRVRNGGAAALGAVTAAASTVGNVFSKAMGMPYEVAPGVVVREERPRSPSPAGRGAVAALAATLPPPLAAAVALPSPPPLPPAAAAEGGSRRTVAEEQTAVTSMFKEAKKRPESGRAAAAPVGKKRYRGIVLGPMNGSAPAAEPPAPQPVAASAEPAPAPAPRLERAVVPPLRGVGRRVASAAQSVPMPELPFVDNEALHAAIVESMQPLDDVVAAPALAAESMPTAVAAVTPAAAAAAAPGPISAPEAAAAAAVASSEAAVAAPAHAAAVPETAAVAAAAVALTPAALSEMAVDLLVYMSVQGSKAGAPPGMDELAKQFGVGFAEVGAQLRALRDDGSLLRRHAAVAHLVRVASAARGDGKGLWSSLYDTPDAVHEAEAAMPAFLEDCRTPYPLVQGLMATGEGRHSVSVLCSLCNLVPGGHAPGSSGDAGQQQASLWPDSAASPVAPAEVQQA